MREWLYDQQGEEQGPIPEDNIVELFRSGQLTADTLVWTEGFDEWTVARDVENLVPAAQSPEAIPEVAPAPVAQHDAAQTGPLFLHIPIGRLILMSIISWGLYEAYWIYKNWRYVKERDGLEIKPFWRGIFGIFFVHGIMKTIRNDKQANKLEQAKFSAGGLTAGWIVLILLGNLQNMLIALPSFLCFIPVQIYINRVNAKLNPQPAHAPWSAGHIVCLVIGLALWLMILTSVGILATAIKEQPN